MQWYTWENVDHVRLQVGLLINKPHLLVCLLVCFVIKQLINF